MTATSNQHDSTVISVYTRHDALADGALVDAGELAREAGFRFPVALTRAAWADLVAWPTGDGLQDETGRLWDVLTITRFVIGRVVAEANLYGTAAVPTHVYRVPTGGNDAERADMVVGLALDETGSPAITVMLPGEN